MSGFIVLGIYIAVTVALVVYCWNHELPERYEVDAALERQRMREERRKAAVRRKQKKR